MNNFYFFSQLTKIQQTFKEFLRKFSSTIIMFFFFNEIGISKFWISSSKVRNTESLTLTSKIFVFLFEKLISYKKKNAK